MVVPLFTNGGLGPTRVALDAGAGGMEHASVLFCEELTTLDHGFLVDGPLGPRVAESLLDRAIRSVRRALGEIVLEP